MGSYFSFLRAGEKEGEVRKERGEGEEMEQGEERDEGGGLLYQVNPGFLGAGGRVGGGKKGKRGRRGKRRKRGKRDQKGKRGMKVEVFLVRLCVQDASMLLHATAVSGRYVLQTNAHLHAHSPLHPHPPNSQALQAGSPLCQKQYTAFAWSVPSPSKQHEESRPLPRTCCLCTPRGLLPLLLLLSVSHLPHPLKEHEHTRTSNASTHPPAAFAPPEVGCLFCFFSATVVPVNESPLHAQFPPPPNMNMNVPT